MKLLLTPKARLILLLVLGLLLAGLVSRDGRVALLGMPFVIYLTAGLLTAPRAAVLAARREMGSRRAEAGQKETMRLAVENAGPDLPLVSVVDELPSGARMEGGCAAVRGSLRGGESLDLCYTFSAGRGRYDWRAVSTAVSDLFGLFEIRQELDAPGALHVLPAQPPAGGLRLRPRQTRPTAGPHLSRRAGQGTDFFGVREYHPGDSLRRVAWRLAARHPGEFYSREFEQEGMADVGILLDARASIDLERDGRRLLEYSIQAASALAGGFLDTGDRVSLLILGRRITRVFPGIGKRQNMAIREALAACQPGENVSFETLKYLPVKLFPARSTLVVVSPLRRGDLPPLTRLCAAGYQVIVVSPDTAAFTARGDTPGGRAAALERRLLLQQARRVGIRVVSWRVDEPLGGVLRSPVWVQP